MRPNDSVGVSNCGTTSASSILSGNGNNSCYCTSALAKSFLHRVAASDRYDTRVAGESSSSASLAIDFHHRVMSFDDSVENADVNTKGGIRTGGRLTVREGKVAGRPVNRSCDFCRARKRKCDGDGVIPCR